jgi:hypothetical protein
VFELGKKEMLTDHRVEQERWARENRQRRKLPRDFGKFIASLPGWDWFVTVTLRSREPQREETWERGKLRRKANVTICKPDPQLVRYEPSSRYSRADRAPNPQVTLWRIKEWLKDIEKAAGKPIGWVIAEEFGRWGGRWHCHILITGVLHLCRKKFLLEACRRFGYTSIEPYDPARGAAYYLAKYSGRTLGEIHFGGTLAGVDLSQCEKSLSEGGGRDVTVSVPLPKSFFHMCLTRRHR